MIGKVNPESRVPSSSKEATTENRAPKVICNKLLYMYYNSVLVHE